MVPQQGGEHWGPLPGSPLEPCGRMRPAGVLFPGFPLPWLSGCFRAGEDERDGGTQGTEPRGGVGAQVFFLNKLIFLTVPETKISFFKNKSEKANDNQKSSGDSFKLVLNPLCL